MPPTPTRRNTPPPPPENAPALARLGWALRQRRGDRTRRQLHHQLGYSVSTIKQVETGAYRSDLGPYLAKWAELHGGLDEELRRLWAQAQLEGARARPPRQPAPARPAAPRLTDGAQAPVGVLTLPAVPPGMAYLVIPVAIDALDGTLGLPDGAALIPAAGGGSRRRTRRWSR